jgi:hypothetical protein
MRLNRFASLVLAVALAVLLAAAQMKSVAASSEAIVKTYYVSPHGSDMNNGLSPGTAFATLYRARDALRALNKRMRGNIVVRILPGNYFMRRTLNLTAKDSGSHGYRISYVADGKPGSVRLIGGVAVTHWRPYRGEIWRAAIGSGRPMRTLYEDGIRADMARWPKRTSPFATSCAGYMTYYKTLWGKEFIIGDNAVGPNATAFNPAGKNLFHAWLYGFVGPDGHRWTEATAKVTKVAGNAIYVVNSQGLGWPDDSCFIENSLGLLSQPGEYYYSRRTGELYYRSRFAGPIQRQHIVAPDVTRLINIHGTSGNPVRNITFSGLTFAATNAIFPTRAGDWGFYTPAMRTATVYARNASGIAIQDCEIADAGCNGITLAAGATHCRITDSLIEHTGICGILLQGDHCTVSDCVLRYCGELQGQGDGIEITGNGHDTLKHLDIYYCARAGISIGAADNLVECVRVHDCVQDTADQGALYLVDPAKNNTFNQCVSYRNYVDLSCMDRPPTGVYNDRDATGTHWSNIDTWDDQFYLFRHDPMRKPGKPITFFNVNWRMKYRSGANQATLVPNPDFNRALMHYRQIGVTSRFPSEFNNLHAPPSVPLNLWGQVDNGQVTLHWTQSDRAKFYIIKRSTSRRGLFRPVGESRVPKEGWYNGTTYVDRNMINGRKYYFEIVAANAAGLSAPGAAISMTPEPWGSMLLAGKIIGTVAHRQAAFDGNLRTCTGQSGWVGLDLGSPKIITEIQYSPRADNLTTVYWMAGGRFEGSNSPDFTDPVTLFRIWGTKGGAVTPVLIPVAIFNATPFRYVRYIGLHNSTVAEIKFYGHAPHGHQ